MLIYFFLFLFGVKSESSDEKSVAIAGLTTDWTGITEDPFIYVATADGFIHCINIFTGDEMWSFDTGGCIFGSTETEKTTFVPSLDGYLFTFISDYGYRRVPMPIRDLVFFSPFRTETGDIFTSGKSTTMFFLDENGKVTYSCRSNSTVPTQQATSPNNENRNKDENENENESENNGSDSNSNNNKEENSNNKENKENKEKNNANSKNNEKNKENNKKKETKNQKIIFRLDYTLNIFDETVSKIVKFSEFDVFSGYQSNNEYYSSNAFKTKVTTTFSGGITININGTTTAQIKINGVPTSIFGTNGKFDFEMNSNGRQMSRSSIASMNILGNHVVVPSKPLTTPMHFDILQSGLPALPGNIRNNDENSHFRFNYGVFDIRRPFVAFCSLQPNADPRRPADQMLEQLSYTISTRSFYVNYWAFSSILFFIFMILRMAHFYFNKLEIALASSVQIIVSESDQAIGTFNNVQCSIVYSDSVDEMVLKEISEISHPNTVKIKAFVKQNKNNNSNNIISNSNNNNNNFGNSEGNDNNKLIVIACQPLVPYDFEKVCNNPAMFIKRMMGILSSLFKHGLVHGSIDSSSIFTDNDGMPILGNFHISCHYSSDVHERANDVRNIAKIVQKHYYSSLSNSNNDNSVNPENSDNNNVDNGAACNFDNNVNNNEFNNNNDVNNDNNSDNNNNNNKNSTNCCCRDPLVHDLLMEMLAEADSEQPTPEEVLCHPLFLSGVQKLDLIAHASDFLQSKTARNRRIIQIFEQHSKNIVGENWMRFLDHRLLQDAINHRDYQGESAVELIRFIRNKWLHMPIMPNGKKFNTAGSNADEYFNYFHQKYPNLFLYTYYFLDRYEIDNKYQY